jgi:hypothetical protein
MSDWMQFLDHEDNIIERLIVAGATVEDLLDQEEVLQEWKMQNQKLLELYGFAEVGIWFIDTLLVLLVSVCCSCCGHDNLLILMRFLVGTKRRARDVVGRYRNPYVASEMLSEDIPQVREAMMDPECLEILFGFIERREKTEAVLARNVCRVFHNMLCQFGKEVCGNYFCGADMDLCCLCMCCGLCGWCVLFSVV